jgi:hypothetical protein
MQDANVDVRRRSERRVHDIAALGIRLPPASKMREIGSPGWTTADWRIWGLPDPVGTWGAMPFIFVQTCGDPILFVLSRYRPSTSFTQSPPSKNSEP